MRCRQDPRHGYWSSAYPQMARLPADPDAILALARDQAEAWHDRVAEYGFGILIGRGQASRCRICGGGLAPVSPQILAEAERLHVDLSTN